MYAVADINTLWRQRPFEALGKTNPVLGLLPMDPLFAWRRFHWPVRRLFQRSEGSIVHLPVIMPFGWATRRAKAANSYLWGRARTFAKENGRTIQGLFITSPHYLPLVRSVKGEIPCYYYCSDDYGSYCGWGDAILEFEHELISLVQHSFFVSQALADRAIQKRYVAPERISVSMNATEEIFLEPIDVNKIRSMRENNRSLRPPLVGVVGGINSRLDFNLLKKCAELKEMGTLLFVGPLDDTDRSATLSALRNHPKCVFVGKRPHNELPLWLQMLDVALIPYRKTQFNNYCSPMRLFDHLASGRPIIATSACPQVIEMKPWVETPADDESFLAALALRLKGEAAPRLSDMVSYCARNHTWAARAQGLRQVLWS